MTAHTQRACCSPGWRTWVSSASACRTGCSAWPSIHAFFRVPLDAVGSLLVMFPIGYLFSSFGSGWILARLNVGVLPALSCLATAVRLLGYALTPWWSLMAGLGGLAGWGPVPSTPGCRKNLATCSM